MTRYPSSYQPHAHLIDGLHRHAQELSSALASLFLLIQECYGKDELLRIQQEARNAVS